MQSNYMYSWQWSFNLKYVPGKSIYLSWCNEILRSGISCKPLDWYCVLPIQITAPVELEVLMSALKDDQVELSKDGTKKIHQFNQPVRIPSYLIAIVAGALESR
jgi:hypothetical protein